jgi:CRISPR type III-B/RAMP module-associated protein Cmr3
MNTILIEPTDVLFFRDAVPMSAGHGKGAGCRMPFPSTLHEAFRASLLRARGETEVTKAVPGRPRNAERKGNWHEASHKTDIMIASKAFCSLQTVGPLPWHPKKELLLPVPMDAAFTPDRTSLARLHLGHDQSGIALPNAKPQDFRPLCVPLATTPPDKHRQLHGWWTVAQFRDYLRGETNNADERLSPVPTDKLWMAEDRIGVQIDPGSFAAASGQLFSGSYLRAHQGVMFAVGAHISVPRNGEEAELKSLPWLLLGGEFRLARLWQTTEAGQARPNYFKPLRQAPTPPAGDGPCLLKWVLITPAIFAHGSLPGWCADTRKDRPGGPLPTGRVCLDLAGRAQLISWCLGKPRTVSGFDVVEGRAKPTMLAVPEGSVYYFLCENRETAAALARKLHWQPRSDFYGEKGCGYGLVSFDVQMHPCSASPGELAKEIPG